MAFLSMLKKNFKLLVRSRSSAFIVFLGPLLIIGLVGLVFSGKGSSDLSVGYYAQEKTDLTEQFVNRLIDSKFIVKEFTSEAECRQSIEQGLLHTCIVFPLGFEVRDDGGSDLRFIVDNSRINLVYKVIDAVSSILESETKELSYSLTSVLLEGINTTISGLTESEELSSEVESLHTSAGDSLKSSLEASESILQDRENISTVLIDVHAENLNITVAQLHADTLEQVAKTRVIIDELNRYLNSSELEEVKNGIDRTQEDMLYFSNLSLEQLMIVRDDIGHLRRELSMLESHLESDRQLNKQVQQGIIEASDGLASAQFSIGEINRLNYGLREGLEGITVKRADTIVSPVNTKIEPISPKASNVLFTFPFLLMLVVMFVSLMLSSTMLVYEKTSKAAFRNFMMPLGKGWMVVSYVVTILLVVLFQSLIILNLAQYTLGIDLLSNPLATILVVLVSALFFTVLGLSIGWLVSTQEAGVMASLVFGSVFLFISNLVVPLENLAPAFASVIAWNPYIIFSEMLRRSLLFGASALSLGLGLFFLFLLSVGVLAGLIALTRKN